MRKLTLLVFLAFLTSVAFTTLDPDTILSKLVKEKNLTSYKNDITADSAKVALGRMLFFDKLLSGNKDLSCATCHHPGLKSGDNLALAIGVGGNGLGEFREMGEGRDRIPRNSPEIFNRGSTEWHSMFWDGRVATTGNGFSSPADEKLPDGLENILAVQAMFPVTSRDEMRGEIGDKDLYGEENELALISNAMPQSIWFALMQRILKYEKYQDLFKAAYPTKSQDQLGFQHAANAIAAFEIAAFTFVDSPWDQYLGGRQGALTAAAKRGALLFFGKADCGSCHSGNLLTDQQFHNIGVPQFGPGKDRAAPLDAGRFAETGADGDRFAFRTPPLRNVALTGPWMHNGAYDRLEDAVKHHLDPTNSLVEFDVTRLPQELQTTYKDDPQVRKKLLSNLDPRVADPKHLTAPEFDDLMAFMYALTDSSALELNSWIPLQVPSGLPVENTLGQASRTNY